MRQALVLLALLAFASRLHAQAPAGAEEANRLYQAQDWAGAARAYEPLLKQSPDSPVFRMRLGASYLNLGRVAEARPLLESASAAPGPFGAAAFFHLARLEARAGNRPGALAALEKATAGGFAQVAMLESQPDFAALRDDPRFKGVVVQADHNARPCAYRPEARQFDFWVGDWDVTMGGATVGTSRVEKILNDCVIFENWTGAAGYEGKSFNVYDTTKKRWQQTWVDGSGRITEYYGEVRGGDLYYTAEGPVTGPDGKDEPALQRMTFFKQGDRVRQLLEQSTDGGKTWSVTFDGLYARKASAR